MGGRGVQRAGGLMGFALMAVALAGLGGCGSGSETFLPVEGEVTFGGKPLAKGGVILYPDAKKGNTTKHEPRGEIEGGRYKITTHPNVGAPPGWYKVGVVATEPTDPKDFYSPRRSVIPEKFGKPDESQLTLEVRSNPPAGAYNLDLK
jgi:hypothetical protein